MARVQNIEATVRHHDALAARLRFRDERRQLVQLDESAPTAALHVQRVLQLRAARRRDTDLAHDDAGAEVREPGRIAGSSPAAMPAASTAITVSPAPVTSNTSRA